MPNPGYQTPEVKLILTRTLKRPLNCQTAVRSERARFPKKRPHSRDLKLKLVHTDVQPHIFRFFTRFSFFFFFCLSCLAAFYFFPLSWSHLHCAGQQKGRLHPIPITVVSVVSVWFKIGLMWPSLTPALMKRSHGHTALSTLLLNC